MKKFIIIILLINVIIKINLNAQEISKPQLEEQFQKEIKSEDISDNKKISYKESWTAIEGILKYRLEIYDLNNNPVYIEETDKNEIEILILPGKYKKRLGLINKFNKLFLYTDWKEFEIFEIPSPTVTYLEKKVLESTKEKDEFQVSVNGLTDSTKIYLKKKNSNELVPIEYKQIDTNRLKIDISPKSLKKGEYNIIIKNSEKKITEIESALLIKEPEQMKESKSKIKWHYLMPGLPQKERKENKKGNLLQWGFIGSVVLTGYFYNQTLKYDKQYDNYIKYTNIANLSNYLRTTSGIIYYYSQTYQIQKIVKNYNTYKNLYYLGLGTGIFIYGYHIYDVIKYEFYLAPKPKEIGAQISIHF